MKRGDIVYVDEDGDKGLGLLREVGRGISIIPLSGYNIKYAWYEKENVQVLVSIDKNIAEAKDIVDSKLFQSLYGEYDDSTKS